MATRLTFEEYQQKVRKRYGNRYKVIKFTTTSDNAVFVCEACGKEKVINAGHVIYDKYLPHLCKECDLKYERQMKFEIEKCRILKDEYTFLDEYLGDGEKIRIRHNKCGAVKPMNPNTLLRNLERRNTCYCSECRPDKKKTTETFSQELFDKSNGNLILEGEYVNAKTKVSVRCMRCGEPLYEIADNVIRRLSCPNCDSNRGEYRRKEYSYYYNQFCKNGKLEEYILDDSDIPKTGKVKAESLVHIKHKVCGVTKEVVLYDIPNYYCVECKKKERIEMQFAKFCEEFDKESRGEYELLEDVKYENNQTKMKILHKICGNPFMCSRNHFISAGVRCSFCNQSKGERMTRELLEDYGYLVSKVNYNAKFINEKTRREYELDIQVVDENGGLIAVIEYDGEQHFNSEKCFGMEKNKWEQIVFRDNERNRIAKENGIPLLRIPYIYDNKLAIEAVLNDFFVDLEAPEYIYDYYSQYEFSNYKK